MWNKTTKNNSYLYSLFLQLLSLPVTSVLNHAFFCCCSSAYHSSPKSWQTWVGPTHLLRKRGKILLAGKGERVVLPCIVHSVIWLARGEKERKTSKLKTKDENRRLLKFSACAVPALSSVVTALCFLCDNRATRPNLVPSKEPTRFRKAWTYLVWWHMASSKRTPVTINESADHIFFYCVIKYIC